MHPRYKNQRKRKIKNPIMEKINFFRDNMMRALAYIGMYAGSNKWMDVDKVRVELEYCREQLDDVIAAIDNEYGPPTPEKADDLRERLVYIRETMRNRSR